MAGDLKKEITKTLDFLKERLKQIRTGRANTAIADNIQVEVYGTKMPLNQLATLTVPEAKTILISPWDKSNLGIIAKAIQASDLGINPVVEGDSIRLTLPPMTEERRNELVKVVKDELENARVSIRNERKKALQALERDSAESKDAKERIEKQIDEDVGKANEEIGRLGEAKESEITSL